MNDIVDRRTSSILANAFASGDFFKSPSVRPYDFFFDHRNSSKTLELIASPSSKLFFFKNFIKMFFFQKIGETDQFFNRIPVGACVTTFAEIGY